MNTPTTQDEAAFAEGLKQRAVYGEPAPVALNDDTIKLGNGKFIHTTQDINAYNVVEIYNSL